MAVAAVAALIGAIAANAQSRYPRPPHAYTTVPAIASDPAAPDDAGELFRVGRNRRIIRQPGAQSETTIAVDPTDPNHLLAASNDLADSAAVYESLDGGRTWAFSYEQTAFCYDPWLTFRANGDQFYTYECSGGAIQRVAYRLVGQANWTEISLNNAGGFPDRDMIVVDNHANSPFRDSVYIGYDDANAGNVPFLLYSRTGTADYIRTPDLNDTTQPTIGVNAAVCADGTVTAGWLEFNRKALVTASSSDGGASWGADVIAHNYLLNTPQFFISIPPQPQRGIVPFPFLDAATEGAEFFPGRMYVTYTDRDADSTDTDVFARYSDDCGATWSAQVEIDNEGADDAYQFHPAISVGEDGTVFVSYYDTRHDATSKTIHRWMAYSQDGGNTWTNEQMSSGPSDFSGAGDGNDTGDYQGTHARPGFGAWSIWTDRRSGNEDGVGAAQRP
jgi:hypothetical protein